MPLRLSVKQVSAGWVGPGGERWSGTDCPPVTPSCPCSLCGGLCEGDGAAGLQRGLLESEPRAGARAGAEGGRPPTCGPRPILPLIYPPPQICTHIHSLPGSPCHSRPPGCPGLSHMTSQDSTVISVTWEVLPRPPPPLPPKLPHFILFSKLLSWSRPNLSLPQISCATLRQCHPHFMPTEQLPKVTQGGAEVGFKASATRAYDHSSPPSSSELTSEHLHVSSWSKPCPCDEQTIRTEV